MARTNPLFVLADHGYESEHHVTLLPEFTLPSKEAETEFVTRMTGLLYNEGAIHVNGEEEKQFVSNSGAKVFHVLALHQTEQMTRLHNALADIAEDLGAEYAKPQFTRGGFIPHATNATMSTNLAPLTHVSLSVEHKTDHGKHFEIPVMVKIG